MNARSEAALATVDPDLATKVRTAADNLATAGTHLLVVSGLRTAAEQSALYAQGRNGAPGHIVTNAKAGQSMHNYGLAVDVVPYLSGPSGALNWHADTLQFQAMVSAFKAQGLVWGGDWVSFKDEDHFQMPGVPANPTQAMEADYGDGGNGALSTIWGKLAGGSYNA
jgi:peptidoglycan L-alanyl-D-glutamate endopeptidase CwlK